MKTPKSFGFGARLRAARIAKNITGEELGKGCGPEGRDASKASVSDWENERHYPKADQLRIICLKLNIGADHLIFGDLQADQKALAAASAVQQLTEEQRRTLFRSMMADAVPDSTVEHRMPITRQRAAKRAK